MAYNFSGLNKRPEHGDLAKILAIGFVLLAIRFIGFAALPGLCLVFFEGGSSTVESFGLPGSKRSLAFAHERISREFETGNSAGRVAGMHWVDDGGVQFFCGQG